MAGKRAGTVGALAVAVTTVVALASAPSLVSRRADGAYGQAQAGVAAARSIVVAGTATSPQPIPPAVITAGAVLVTLTLIGLVVAATPRPLPAVRRRPPVARAPPRRSV